MNTAFLGVAMILLQGCASVGRGPGLPQRGLASWYGKNHEGKRTASGEKFDRQALTAAHRTLPFGTKVRVRNLANDLQVVVRVNDRGPFTSGRVIDLSEAAARTIEMISAGEQQVELSAVAER